MLEFSDIHVGTTRDITATLTGNNKAADQFAQICKDVQNLGLFMTQLNDILKSNILRRADKILEIILNCTCLPNLTIKCLRTSINQL